VLVRRTGDGVAIGVTLKNSLAETVVCTPALTSDGRFARPSLPDRRTCNGRSALAFGFEIPAETLDRDQRIVLHLYGTEWEAACPIAFETTTAPAHPFVETGSVSGTMRPGRPRFGRTDFVAEISNRTDLPVLCSVAGVTRGGEVRLASYDYIFVDPGTNAIVPFSAPWRFPWRIHTVIVRMKTDRMDYAVDAPVPAPRAYAIAPWAAMLLIALGAGVAGTLHKRAPVAIAPVRPKPPATTAKPVLPGPQIQTLDVLPAVADAGSTMQVRYAASARNGTVQLLDQSNVPWATVPYRRNGVALLAPQVPVPTRFYVRLLADENGRQVSATAGVLVVPRPTPSPTPSSSPAPSNEPAVGNAPTLRIDPSRPVSGHAFSVASANRSDGPLQITLQDSRGTPITSSTATHGAPATFVAPLVASDTGYFLVTTIQRGKNAQLVVQPITVYAR
jgi:hypothetical protein